MLNALAFSEIRSLAGILNLIRRLRVIRFPRNVNGRVFSPDDGALIPPLTGAGQEFQNSNNAAALSVRSVDRSFKNLKFGRGS
jgi:hypothetical protein